MNIDNVRKWTNDLRTTAAIQIHGQLSAPHAFDPSPGYCCLGRGCVVADLEIQPYQKMPSTDFHRWLGVTPPEVWSEGDFDRDVDIDWPRGEDAYPSLFGFWMNYSCSTMNDEIGLSFSQIADVIDYFGLREKGVAE